MTLCSDLPSQKTTQSEICFSQHFPNSRHSKLAARNSILGAASRATQQELLPLLLGTGSDRTTHQQHTLGSGGCFSLLHGPGDASEGSGGAKGPFCCPMQAVPQLT